MKKLFAVSLLLGILFSCMTAEKHLEKFYKKGGKLEPVERIVAIHDTIPGVDGKDSIIERLIEVPCPEPEPPKTKWKVRFDNKRFKDSLKHVRKMYSDSSAFILDSMSLENERLEDSLKRIKPLVRYQEKTDRATSRHNSYGFLDYLWVMLAFAGGFLARHFLLKLKLN